jgi:acetylornithine/succinyldiaminopimelate/putrescine aminotransferase
MDSFRVRADGHYVAINERRIFDGVAGIACSVRGHNPADYVEALEKSEEDCRQEVAERLLELTGLEHHVPAVSGATAVENALRLGLTSAFPRDYVLAFKGGFGGKTLLSLTGTANSSYKEHLDPLYDKVVYLDPWAPSILGDLETAFKTYPVGVVQLELIQAVGGIRPMPEAVVRWLDQNRRKHGYLLFVDEVQTGMYRTGSFTRSEQVRIAPDLLTLGKGTSDMMFPFALTLYSSAIQRRLDEIRPGLPHELRMRYDYEFGYRTVRATLERAQESDLAVRVAQSAELFARLLQENLGNCKSVREVRVHGLLIAIEIDKSRWPERWFTTRIPLLYALAMMRSKEFPLIMGYCQYEPNVLKFTPPLSTTEEEIHRACSTIARVLKRPFYRLLPPALWTIIRSKIWR